jgi:hypothetical protein
MTPLHALYIPTIFLMGLTIGALMQKRTLARATPIEQRVNLPRKRSGRFLFGAFLVVVAAFILTHFFEIPNSSKAVSLAIHQEIFDKTPSFSSQEVYARISHFPEYGIEMYKKFTYTVDIFFPVCLLIFLMALAQYAKDGYSLYKGISRNLLHLPPLLWFASDMMENTLIYHMLDIYPVEHHTLAGALGYLTLFKFSLLLLSMLLPAVILVYGKFNLPSKTSAQT